MATRSRNWLRWVALAVGAIAAWQVGSHLIEYYRSGPDKLINQLWVERMPASPRDMVWHFIAVEQDGHHIGALGRASRWRVHIDRFLWRQQADQITIVTPQSKCRSTLKARTWKCAGEAPKPFELCLELTGGGKSFRYYSRNDWSVRPRDQLDDGELAFATSALQSAQPADSDDDSAAELDTAAECATLPGSD
jgi:hypothetical protein